MGRQQTARFAWPRASGVPLILKNKRRRAPPEPGAGPLTPRQKVFLRLTAHSRGRPGWALV